jgi:hypothetical protein
MNHRPKELPRLNVHVFGVGANELLSQQLVAIIEDEEDEAKELSRKTGRDDRRRR